MTHSAEEFCFSRCILLDLNTKGMNATTTFTAEFTVTEFHNTFSSRLLLLFFCSSLEIILLYPKDPFVLLLKVIKVTTLQFRKL